MTHILVELLLGFGIGLSLGLVGGGGSILTVPALVYIIGQSPQAAVTTSLAIVGANSAFGALLHNKSGACNWNVAVLFGSAGMVVAFLAAGLSRLFSPEALMSAFAILMVAIGGVMLLQKSKPSAEVCRRPNLVAVVFGGAGVGLLTGILGVGGGFLIVPALVLLVGLPISQAVGTSLIIIAGNSLAGLLGHLEVQGINLSLTLVFVAAGLAGTFTGSRVAHKLPARWLRAVFAWFVIILGVYLLYDNLPYLVSI